jgi:hypothetical protein
MTLESPSIINGSQTRGELKRYLEEMKGTDLTIPNVFYQIIITTDDELVAEISIARNFQNDVKPISIAGRLPYLKFCFWTTRWLHDFMIHQPSTSIVILEVEEEAENSAFSLLQERGRFTLIEPSTLEIERYILGNKEYPIVLKPLIHDSPLTQESGVPIPKLGKILVDMYVEKELFLPFQGKELVNIYKGIFNAFNVNTTTLLAYASRRGKRAEIMNYLQMSV